MKNKNEINNEINNKNQHNKIDFSGIYAGYLL